MSFLKKPFGKKVKIVDAMIGICIHAPGTVIEPPSNIRQWATEVLAEKFADGSLFPDAKVGFLVASGSSSFKASEKSAWKDLPEQMRTFMTNNGLEPSAYEFQSFSEDLRRDIKVLCMVAIRN